MQILLKATTEREALIARAHLVRALQEVCEEGLTPKVEVIDSKSDAFSLRISQ